MRSNKEWRAWGKADPLWSIASWAGKEREGSSPWTREQFIALGAADFRDILHHWNHYGLVGESCVEIGCGAGRMTAQLATAFSRVLALDVSSDQIALARDLLGPLSAKVEFHQVDAPTIPVADSTYTAMFSSHVFQHFPGFSGIARYLAEGFRVLKSGATVCLHIPVIGSHRSSHLSWPRLALHNAAVTVRRLLGRLRVMEYHRYSALRVFRTLDELGFRDAELRVFNMRSNGDAHSFFFCRRP
jgi:ubiquinone/menaquinone biosynthesis C-methylase UbiE